MTDNSTYPYPPINEISTGQPGRFSHFLKNPIKIENFRMSSLEKRNVTSHFID
ncbi:MAG: hypothetical protein NT166_18590 [Candidatus Aminicenantes bacterium]|nr:hypothetical protein [Candidatus Aminicenantes bacterium]